MAKIYVVGRWTQRPWNCAMPPNMVVAAHHPDGKEALEGLSDRGVAVSAMAKALTVFSPAEPISARYIDGTFRANLAETGMSYALEIEMIARTAKKDMLTTPYM